MYHTPNQNPQVIFNGKTYEADLERLCFVHYGSCLEVIPFHTFSELEWNGLHWESGWHTYELMIEKTVQRLASCKVISSETTAMLDCVCRHYESGEQYEELASLQKKRAWIFKLAGAKVLEPARETREIPVKPCNSGIAYVYDVVKKSDCCFEETFRTNEFIFERIFIHRSRPQELPHSMGKKKGEFVKSKTPHPFLVTDYYRVLCNRLGKSLGVLHVLSDFEGLKEIHCKVKSSFTKMKTAAVEFTEGFGRSFYYRRLQCFVWTGEATYLVSKHHDPRSACDPAFHPIHYVLVPDREESRLKIQSRANGTTPGSMDFTGNNQEVTVTYRGETIATCQSPPQGLFLLELQKGANEIPF